MIFVVEQLRGNAKKTYIAAKIIKASPKAKKVWLGIQKAPQNKCETQKIQ